jgi:hypothetical protein
MKLKTQVVIKNTLLEGVVDDVEWDKDRDCKRVKVSFVDTDDVEQSRWFLETDLEPKDA